MTGTDTTLNGGDALRSFDAGRHTASDFLAAWFDLTTQLGDDARRQFERPGSIYYAGYLKRFDSYMRHSYDRRLEPLLTRVRAGRRARVLEVGSGCGSECLFMASLGCDVTGIEIHNSQEAASCCQESSVAAGRAARRAVALPLRRGIVVR